jgi:hypothetical protein
MIITNNLPGAPVLGENWVLGGKYRPQLRRPCNQRRTNHIPPPQIRLKEVAKNRIDGFSKNRLTPCANPIPSAALTTP